MMEKVFLQFSHIQLWPEGGPRTSGYPLLNECPRPLLGRHRGACHYQSKVTLDQRCLKDKGTEKVPRSASLQAKDAFPQSA